MYGSTPPPPQGEQRATIRMGEAWESWPQLASTFFKIILGVTEKCILNSPLQVISQPLACEPILLLKNWEFLLSYMFVEVL